MGRVSDSLTFVQQLIRTVIALVLLAGLFAVGWVGYGAYAQRRDAWDDAKKELASLKEQLDAKGVELGRVRSDLADKTRQVESLLEEVGDLKETVAQQAQKIERLDTALRLLKVRRRVARLRVLDRRKDETTGEFVSRVEFAELDDEGKPLDAPKRFTVKGETIYIDSWVVKFEDHFVEQADIDRSTSLVFFRRIFTDKQQPAKGFELDAIGARPKAYGGNRSLSDFERAIWKDFWTIATDEKRARQLGIRAAHGEAPSIPLIKGKVYRIELRASDGLSIRPETDAPDGSSESEKRT